MAYGIESRRTNGGALAVRETSSSTLPKPCLLDRVRMRHYSRRTEKAYVHCADSGKAQLQEVHQ